jgi:hypothetical protein
VRSPRLLVPREGVGPTVGVVVDANLMSFGDDGLERVGVALGGSYLPDAANQRQHDEQKPRSKWPR